MFARCLHQACMRHGDRWERSILKKKCMVITMLSFFLFFFFLLCYCWVAYDASSLFQPSSTLACFLGGFCPCISTAALAPPPLHAPFPPSSPRLSLPHPLSSFSLSAVQHGDYHSTHRVRPDSQILLSTILHHLLLVGAMEGEKLRQGKRDDVGGWGWGGDAAE